MSMIHEITASVPRNKRSQRKGRGESSGRGKTSGRGNKGAKARVGTYIKRGHEGGQTPIFRRFPKRGFSNVQFEHRYHVVNVSDLERFEDGATVDASALIEAGLVSTDRLTVKVLGDGSMSKRLTVIAGAFSRSAYEKIIQGGGAAQNLKGEPYQLPKEKKQPAPPVEAKTAKQERPKKSKKAAEPQPTGEQPASETVDSQQPTAEQPALEQPALEQPIVEKPAGEQAGQEQSE
jgi:large subunit ribosomal protein L15